MYDGQTVGVVIPAYNEAGFVGDVIETLPSIVDRAYVVDDCSTDDTWTEIEEAALRTNEQAAAADAPVAALSTQLEGTATDQSRERGHARGIAAGSDAEGEATVGSERRNDDSVTAADAVQSTPDDAREPNESAIPGLTGSVAMHTDGGQSATPHVVTVRHAHNRGVGGAIKTGYELAREDGLDVVAVMNGDGQMDPSLLQRILDPVVDGRADYAKGNRLDSPDHRAGMPAWRLFGNAILTYLTKCVSGYWRMSDPQNGYTAVSRRALEAIDVDRLYEGYGFCNDVLVRLNVHGFRVEDVPMPARYGDEQSHIRYSRFVPSLSWLLLRRGFWRYRTQYAGAGLRPPYLLLLAGIGGCGVGLTALGLAVLTVGVGSAQAQVALLATLLGALFVALAVTMDRLRSRDLEREVYGPIGGEQS